jgi:hypothetical protein
MEGSGSFSGGLNVDATNEQATTVLTETNSTAHLDISRTENNRQGLVRMRYVLKQLHSKTELTETRRGTLCTSQGIDHESFSSSPQSPSRSLLHPFLGHHLNLRDYLRDL